MLKIIYSKNSRYLLGKEKENYYIIDADSDGLARYYISPNNYSKRIYPISKASYTKLKKQKNTAHSLGIGGVSLMVFTSTIGGGIYRSISNLNIEVNHYLLLLCLATLPAVRIYQMIKDQLTLKIYNIHFCKNKKITANFHFKQDVVKLKIIKGNVIFWGFIALLLYAIYDVSNRSNDVMTVVVAVFVSIIIFYRHRLFLIGLTDVSEDDIAIQIEGSGSE